MFEIGLGKILLVLIVALLVFGPKRLPELAHKTGKTLSRLRRYWLHIQSEFAQLEKNHEQRKD